MNNSRKAHGLDWNPLQAGSGPWARLWGPLIKPNLKICKYLS